MRSGLDLNFSDKTHADDRKARMIKDIEIDKLNMEYFDGMHEMEPKCKLTLPFPVYPSLRHGACPAVGQAL